MKNSEVKLIEQNAMNWLKENIHFIKVGSAIEVATPLIGAYGDLVYCWIEKEDDYYRITDDGGTLFKLDPGHACPSHIIKWIIEKTVQISFFYLYFRERKSSDNCNFFKTEFIKHNLMCQITI